METNGTQQAGRKDITPSGQEDLLSFDDLAIDTPKTLSSSVTQYTFRENIPSAHGDENAIVDVSSGYLKKASPSSNGNQGDAKSSLPLSPDGRLEFIFGPPLKKPESPLFNKSSHSLQASSLFAQQSFTNVGQGLSAPNANTTILLPKTNLLLEESSRSSSPDLIQFTPPKQNLPKEETPKAKNLLQIHASKLNFGSSAFLSLNPFPSSSIPRTTGGLKETRASFIENPRTLDSKILKSAIIDTHQDEGVQKVSRTGMAQSDTFDKSLLARTADMELSPVSHHADVVATTVSSIYLGSSYWLTGPQQAIDLIATQQTARATHNPAQSTNMPDSEIPLLPRKDEAGSPVIIPLGPGNQTPSGNFPLQLDPSSLEKYSASVSPINQVPTPFALATRTTDDVFAELRRPLHRQGSHNQIDNKPSSSFDNSKSNDGALNNNQGSNQKDPPVVEEKEEEEEDMNQAIPDIKRISARKQKNAAIFDVFLKEATKQPKTEKISHANDEAIQSTRWLIDQAEKQHIIESPRDYQLELFEKAKKQNIIAVLDTGKFLWPFSFYQSG